MTLSETRTAASENLVATYTALGTAVPGAELLEDDGFLACTGPVDHPICNFAARLRLDPWSARRLRELAASRFAFHVYRLPGDGPEHAPELLGRAGFEPSYQLVQMVAERPEPGPIVEPRRAEGLEDRLAAAMFMCRQFFAKQDEAFRRRVTSATAGAGAVELYTLEERAQKTAAIMICHAADVIGVYNLCVASSRRGRGMGSGLLNWALALARESGQAVTLQCDARLETWYRYWGFSSVGFVDVYSLAKTVQDDIIL